jgi:hypothetical protein
MVQKIRQITYFDGIINSINYVIKYGGALRFKCMPMEKTFVYDTSCHRFTIFEPQILFDTPSEEFVVILYKTWYLLASLDWQDNFVLNHEQYIQYLIIYTRY